MIACSTAFLIEYRTGPMSHPDVVPGYLRRDFDPARLQAWLVWCVAWLMTLEWAADTARGLFDDAVFVAVWAVVLGCVAWLQIKEIKNGRLVLC